MSKALEWLKDVLLEGWSSGRTCLSAGAIVVSPGHVLSGIRKLICGYSSFVSVILGLVLVNVHQQYGVPEVNNASGWSANSGGSRPSCTGRSWGCVHHPMHVQLGQAPQRGNGIHASNPLEKGDVYIHMNS